ncbi:MAG: ArsA family ATPase [Sandaracinaceae bacterium]
MSTILDREFLFVTGKGGVGKTTVAAALALAAVKRKKRVLLAMCNAKERLSHLLEVAPIGHENVEVAPGLDAVNMTPASALEEYGMLVLKVRSLYSAIFENKFVAAVLRGTPGIEAWAMLGKAQFHVHERTPDGRRRYDLVIVDGPATGHALDMLRVPQVLTKLAPPGLLRNEAEKARALFTDAHRSAIVLCTLPEDMPANETLELYEKLTRDVSMSPQALVINGVVSKLFKAGEHEEIEALPAKLEAHTRVRSLALAGRERAIRERAQDAAIAKLKAALPDLPRTQLPLLFVPEFRRSAVESLAEAF